MENKKTKDRNEYHKMYMRQYRKLNKEKTREITERYWKKRLGVDKGA